MTFKQASHACQKRFNGLGRLFEPRNEKLYPVIFEDTDREFFGSKAHWIGIKRDKISFQYATGGALVMEKWNSDQSDLTLDCVEVQSTGKYWNKVNCDKKLPSICEKIESM